MFIGHFGIGLGAKRFTPGISLGLLFLAAQFLDLLWPTLLLLGIEHVEITNDPQAVIPLVFTDYPVSHSLLMAVAWSIAFGFVYWLIRKNRKYALVLGLCVLSHWLLDFIVHVPDLPLYPGNAPYVGLGLWSSKIGTAVVEGIIFLTGLYLYLRQTEPSNMKGKYGFWILVILLVVVHVANVFSPPPTSVSAVAWGAQLQWLLVILAFWVARNRQVLTELELSPIH